MKGTVCSLRPIRRSDLHLLNVWKNDEEVYMYLGGGYAPLSEDQQEKWMDGLMDLTGSSRRFLVLDEAGSAVGMVGLYDISWIHRSCEIGAYLGEASARGRGIATEACTLLENYARDYLNLRKLKLKAVSTNTAALGLWKKLGYEKVGEFKAERFIKGRYHDLTLMEKFL